MGYQPVCYSHCKMYLPEMNWRCSVSCDVFNFADKEPYRVFWQFEPPEILNIEDKLIRNAGFYDLILAWNQRILNECGNARFFACAGVWNRESDTSQKEFQVSYLTSSKTGCHGHRYRLSIFHVLDDFKCAAPITKHMSPPWLSDKRDLLVPFQFSIVMENAIHDGYFTEKVLDAFATKTIPIYWGAPNIDKFFNKDGILSFSGTQDLTDILSSLKPTDYESRREAIEDNYQRALKYEDRAGNVARAIEESWVPKIPIVHEARANEMGGNNKEIA